MTSGKKYRNGVRILMRTVDYMKMAAFEELKEAVKIKRVNDELLEYLASSLRYILHYSKKYDIPIPER